MNAISLANLALEMTRAVVVVCGTERSSGNASRNC
jgi:hypothetical protein